MWVDETEGSDCLTNDNTRLAGGFYSGYYFFEPLPISNEGIQVDCECIFCELACL